MPSTVSIQTVAARTGLSVHAIRAWERRYSAIAPARTTGRHRMYSASDVERLSLLAQACRNGHKIGSIAHLETSQLAGLSSNRPVQVPGGFSSAGTVSRDERAQALAEAAIDAVLTLDTRALDSTFNAAQMALGDHGLLVQIIAPLAYDLGERWRAGLLTAAQEHFFSATARVFLWNLTRQYRPDHRSPRLLVGTPAGQVHDLGAAMAATAAANVGWTVTFVGANLPAFELAGAAQLSKAKAVALSIVYPEDDPGLPSELDKLRELLPERIPILVGGRASSAYADALQRNGALLCGSLEQFCQTLDEIRQSPETQLALVR